jgi:D-alanyl-D-alanine-carboxypeptidase/D-alanyl-D-alanine-endopeptidase
MFRALVVFAAIGTSALPLTTSAQQPSARTFPSDSAVLAIIKQRVEEKRAAGIVVGLMSADGKTRVVAFGDPGPGQPPLDANSVFEIGSISKVFTSTVLAQMVLEGKVKLDDPVQKYLPATVKMPTRNGKAITLGTLSTQNSGLPGMPNNFQPKDQSNPYADYTVQQMYEFLSAHQLRRDPGERFEYSNLGVGLLGHALSLAAGKSYEQLEQEKVWSPLGMSHTAITFTPWMKEHLALGHDGAGAVTSNWDIPTLAGAGAIRSTMTDMLKFLDANVHTERGPLGKALEMAHRERASAGGTNGGIGLNWIILKAGTDTIVWHNGGTGGYRTYIGFETSRKMGVVVLTNSGGAGSDDIGMHLLDPALPLAPKPVAMKQRTAIELPVDVLTRYVGTYQLAPEFSIEVTVSEGALYAKATGQGAFRLWPEAETEFFIKEVDAQVSFVREGGVVTALVLHQGGANQTGKKVK